VLLVGGAGALWLDTRWFRFLFRWIDSPSLVLTRISESTENLPDAGRVLRL